MRGSQPVTLIKLLKLPPARGMTIEAVAGSNEVATQPSLVGRSDVIYIPTDKHCGFSLESVIQIVTNNKLPVYVGDNDLLPSGRDCQRLSFSPLWQVDNVQNGYKSPKGEIGEIKRVESPTKLELHVNPRSAQAMEVKIPESVLSEAVKVIK